MKKIIFMLFVAMFSTESFCQTEPDFAMEPHVFNFADSTFEVPLPCERTYVRGKADASLYIFGVGKTSVYRYIDGEKSPLEIDKNVSGIIINTDGESPVHTLSINKLEILKTKRRWKTHESGTFTGSSYGTDASVGLKYKKYGKNSVIIKTSDLSPGEYCITAINIKTTTNNFKAFTFRVKGVIIDTYEKYYVRVVGGKGETLHIHNTSGDLIQTIDIKTDDERFRPKLKKKNSYILKVGSSEEKISIDRNGFVSIDTSFL